MNTVSRWKTPQALTKFCASTKIPLVLLDFWCHFFFYGFSYALWFSRRATSCFCCPKPPPAAPWPSFAAPSAVPRRRLSSSRVRWNLERFRGHHPPNMVSSSQNVVIYGTFLMDLRESSPKFQEFWGHPQKWWYLWFFSMDSHSSSVWWSTKIWWIVPKKCSLQQCMVSISVSGTDHGSHSKPEQDVRNLEPLLLLGCKARLMYVALFDTLNIPFESGNND